MDDTNLSGQMTVAYSIATSVNAYATYATGFKSVGLNLNGLPTDALGRPVLSAATVRPEDVTAAPGNTGLYVGQPGDARTVGVTLRMNFR